VALACLADQAANAAAKSVNLQVQAPDEEILVRADREGLREILDNLVDNALKYTPAGGEVIVGWTCDGRQATLEVRDNGVGIPAEHQGRVFERFYRVDKARSRELGGTGLGLSIVKHLAQSFGGGVTVDSEAGKGACFRVVLPLAEPASPAAGSQLHRGGNVSG
jgi:two-component system phosphate regulon sensor histidine kinase PhoR